MKSINFIKFIINLFYSLHFKNKSPLHLLTIRNNLITTFQASRAIFTCKENEKLLPSSVYIERSFNNMFIFKYLFNLTFYTILLINGLIMLAHSFFGINNILEKTIEKVSNVNIAALF